MSGTQKASKILLIIDLLISLFVTIISLYFIIELSKISSDDYAIIYYVIILIFGIISLAIVGFSLRFLKDNNGSKFLAILLILLSFFFPAGILFLIYSNQQNNKALSGRANQYKYSANQRNVVRKSVVASNIFMKKKIDCYKAIVLLTDLLEKHMINKKDYDELIIKYQDNINKIDKPTTHQKIDPYRALYELNQIKKIINEEDFVKISDKYKILL